MHAVIYDRATGRILQTVSGSLESVRSLGDYLGVVSVSADGQGRMLDETHHVEFQENGQPVLVRNEVSE